MFDRTFSLRAAQRTPVGGRTTHSGNIYCPGKQLVTWTTFSEGMPESLQNSKGGHATYHGQHRLQTRVGAREFAEGKSVSNSLSTRRQAPTLGLPEARAQNSRPLSEAASSCLNCRFGTLRPAADFALARCSRDINGRRPSPHSALAEGSGCGWLCKDGEWRSRELKARWFLLVEKRGEGVALSSRKRQMRGES